MYDYNSFAKKPLQGGGAPNNVHVMQKAERKKINDIIFPFLVPSRFDWASLVVNNAIILIP